MIKQDDTFKAFLTCEDSEKFEKYKNNSSKAIGGSSIPMESLKKLQIQDTFNYFYSSFKTKYFDTSEPQEIQTDLKFDEIKTKILKYLSVIERQISLLEGRINFNKKYSEEELNIAKELSNFQEEDTEFKRILENAGSYFKKSSEVYNCCMEHDKKALSEMKREKFRLEGINAAILDRKTNINQYNTLIEYSKGKGSYLL